MSATPPPPSSPLPEDADDSLEEIDTLTGKEKFRALQKRLSSSNTMYSSPSGVTSLSQSESPPSEAAPPPNKKPHVMDGGEDRDAVFLDDENVASSRAKKLTHATKDRPRRRNVRQPSREKLRKCANPERLEQPVQEPEAITMQEDGSDSPPSLPPLPATPPPPPSG